MTKQQIYEEVWGEEYFYDDSNITVSYTHLSTVPIIIISAKDSDSDKTLGLGLGADDYIITPI